MKILILWADHRSGNLGIQALARGTEAVVRRVWPEAEVDVEVHTPGPWPRFVPALSFARAWVGGDRAERARLSGYDLVIDTGSGDSFADIYGLRRLQDNDVPFSLLTHVIGEDDAAVAAAAEALGGDVEQLVPGDVLEARELIASGRLTIGARMHACLNSLSIGVPALPWAYSRKFEPLMRDLSWPHIVDLRTEPDVAERSWGIARALLDGAASADLAALAELAEARLQVAAETIRTAHG